jgi:hypothetical protein
MRLEVPPTSNRSKKVELERMDGSDEALPVTAFAISYRRCLQKLQTLQTFGKAHHIRRMYRHQRRRNKSRAWSPAACLDLIEDRRVDVIQSRKRELGPPTEQKKWVEAELGGSKLCSLAPSMERITSPLYRSFFKTIRKQRFFLAKAGSNNAL